MIDAVIDVEALVVTWLASRLDSTRVVAELPARFDESLPAVQVTCLPGPKESRPWSHTRPLLWRPRVDIDVYAGSRSAATDLAHETSDCLHDLTGQGTEWGHVTAVGEPAGPSWRPDYNPSVRRCGLTVELTLRAE